MDPAIQVDNEFINKSSLTVLKEVIKRPLEVTEVPCVFDQVCLHFGCQLLEEIELFNDQVEVMQESILYKASDVIVKLRVDVEWWVTLLDLFDPHVKTIHFSTQEVIKVVRVIEEVCDLSNQQREQGHTQEL